MRNHYWNSQDSAGREVENRKLQAWRRDEILSCPAHLLSHHPASFHISSQQLLELRNESSEPTSPDSSTARRVIPSLEQGLGQPGAVSLGQPMEPGAWQGWYLQGRWIGGLAWPRAHLPKWISLKHQGKSGVISIGQIPGLDSQLPAPAECSGCNPEYPQLHQAPDSQHWNQSLKLKQKSDPKLRLYMNLRRWAW